MGSDVASQARVTAMRAAYGQIQMSWGSCGEGSDVRGSIWSVKVDVGGELWGISCFRIGGASVISSS